MIYVYFCNTYLSGECWDTNKKMTHIYQKPLPKDYAKYTNKNGMSKMASII